MCATYFIGHQVREIGVGKEKEV